VVDLGSGSGSFDTSAYPFRTLRVDLSPSRNAGRGCPFVQADAAALPFRDGSISSVVANHCLEHFQDPDSALREVGRTLAPGGRLFISVPDARTFTDRLYRWIAGGGGHVNAFTSAFDLAARVEASTGLGFTAVKPLCTSLSFLNRRNWPGRNSRKLILLGGGTEISLLLINAVLRLSDGIFGSRLSFYGWALYFGPVADPIDSLPWASVCIRCGSGHPSGTLERSGRAFTVWGVIRCYVCPVCGADNLLFSDRTYRHLGESPPTGPSTASRPE
jgi:hypothetical protein